MKTPLLLLAAVGLASTAFAQAPAVRAADFEPAIERAYLRASSSELATAVQPLDQALAADANNPALLYERAFAHFAAAAPLRANNDKEAIEAELDKAATLLERVRGQPWQAEAEGLQGNILGQLIGLKGGMSGMTLGPKSGQLLARAAKALPQSPRVLLYRGLSLINTPEAYGGNPAEGAKLLQQAVDRFAADDGASAGPRWGRADALTWLGVAKQKAGDAAAARALWQQVLQIEPENKWVKFALLPSLDQKSHP